MSKRFVSKFVGALAVLAAFAAIDSSSAKANYYGSCEQNYLAQVICPGYTVREVGTGSLGVVINTISHAQVIVRFDFGPYRGYTYTLSADSLALHSYSVPAPLPRYNPYPGRAYPMPPRYRVPAPRYRVPAPGYRRGPAPGYRRGPAPGYRRGPVGGVRVIIGR